MARVAVVPTWNFDLCVFAVGRLFERDFHRIAQIVAAIDLTATRAAPCLTKDVTKNITKRFTKSAKAFGSAWAAHVGIYACVAVLVVSGTLLSIGQHFVGFFDFFEFDLGLFGRVALIAVRVELHRQFAISLFDFFVAGVLGNAQHFIKISFGHVVISLMRKRTKTPRLFARSRFRPCGA